LELNSQGLGAENGVTIPAMVKRLKRTASWIQDRLEDLAALVVGGGVDTKPPPKDPRNGI
jgi:hypothetical protein